jgi:hypothetical protein
MILQSMAFDPSLGLKASALVRPATIPRKSNANLKARIAIAIYFAMHEDSGRGDSTFSTSFCENDR